jgi:hypothetical protein
LRETLNNSLHVEGDDVVPSPDPAMQRAVDAPRHRAKWWSARLKPGGCALFRDKNTRHLGEFESETAGHKERPTDIARLM